VRWLNLGRRLACLPSPSSAQPCLYRLPPVPAARDRPSIQATPLVTHRDNLIIIDFISLCFGLSFTRCSTECSVLAVCVRSSTVFQLFGGWAILRFIAPQGATHYISGVKLDKEKWTNGRLLLAHFHPISAAVRRLAQKTENINAPLGVSLVQIRTLFGCVESFSLGHLLKLGGFAEEVSELWGFKFRVASFLSGGTVMRRVERWTCDQQVVGSVLILCVTTLGKLFTPMCLCHQAV